MKHAWQPVMRQKGLRCDVMLMQWIIAYQQCVWALAQEGGESFFEVSAAAQLDANQLHPRGRRRELHLSQRDHGGDIVPVAR
jgi:hypothetical protein